MSYQKFKPFFNNLTQQSLLAQKPLLVFVFVVLSCTLFLAKSNSASAATCAMTVSPSSGPAGTTVSVSWYFSSDATKWGTSSASVNSAGGNSQRSGSTSLTLSSSWSVSGSFYVGSKYYGDGCSGSFTLTTPTTPPPQTNISCDIWADSTRLDYGGSTKIKWSSSGGSVVSVEGPGVSSSAANNSSGVSTGALTSSATYKITVNWTNDCSKTVTVAVNEAPPAGTNSCSLAVNLQWDSTYKMTWNSNTTNWLGEGRSKLFRKSTGESSFTEIASGLSLNNNSGRAVSPPTGKYTVYEFRAYDDTGKQYLMCNAGVDLTQTTGEPETPTGNNCDLKISKEGSKFIAKWKSSAAINSSYKAWLYRGTPADENKGLALNGQKEVSPPTGTSTYVILIYNPANNAMITSCSAQVTNDGTGSETTAFRFINNGGGIPFGPVSGADCQNGTANTFLHARDYWLTDSSGSRGPITGGGANSIGLKVNGAGWVCEGAGYTNVNATDGRVNNQTINGDAIYIESASVNVAGLSISGIVGKSIVLSRDAQYANRPGLTHTGVGNFPFTLNGLNNLDPNMQYIVTINTTAVQTARANGALVCASPALKPAGSLNDSGCNRSSATFSIVISGTCTPQTCPPPNCNPNDPTDQCPPSNLQQCQALSPAGAIGAQVSKTIFKGQSTLIKWKTIGSGGSSLKAYAESGSELSGAIGEAAAGITIKPDATTTYYLATSPTTNPAARYCVITIYVEPPANRPYLKIDGSDVVSGATFSTPDPATSCKPTGAAQNASIQTNGFLENRNTWGTSSAQYGAYASGVVGSQEPNTFLANNGYLRGSGNIKDLLFANVFHASLNEPVGSAGKFYGLSGDVMPVPCINLNPDEIKASAFAEGPAGSFGAIKDVILKAPGSGNVVLTGNLTLSGTTEIAGNKTMVVKGNITITGDLKYKLLASSATEVPYLRIIANNVYIERGVNQIDAQLIAYPRVSGDGVIDTCSTVGGAGQWGERLTINGAGNSCNRGRALVVNGSLTARRIIWKSTYGTVGITEGVIDGSCLYSKSSTDCAAEHVIFGAEGYLGLFNNQASQLVSNPVSTVELPPVY